MLKQIEIVLEERCHINRSQKIVIAVSGGPDSLCLLDIMHRLEYPIIVAHLDHSLRPESGEEAEAVGKLAAEMGAPFASGKEDVQHYAEENQLSLEEAAREMRYRFLFNTAEQHHAQAVAVGHHADDQVETVLMHLLRGAGLAGLRGMSFRSLPNPWNEQIPLIRPLLENWREEIMSYVSERGLEPAMDASNLDTRFYRNRLRHELIPYLEDYNPGVRPRLWQMADVLREDDNLIQGMVKQAQKDCILDEGADYFAFDLEALRKQASGIQRRVLRRAIQKLRPGMRNLDYRAITEAQAFIQTPSSSGEIDLLANLRLLQEGNKLWLADWEAQLPGENWPQVREGEETKLNIPGEVKLWGGWKMSAEWIDVTEGLLEQIQQNPNPYQAWLNLNESDLPLTIRSRRAGERFQPLGMGGKSMKISDYMLNKKLPRRARDSWPLVTGPEEIVWVPGYQVGETYRVGQKTRRVLRLDLHRSEN
jgi:tRNA(Ile)-lysidine synthase